MQRLLDQLAETPTLVLGKRHDILAWNASASALYTDFDAYQPPRRNYVYVLFNDPTVRALHHDWIEAASSGVAALRMEAVQDPDDPEYDSRHKDCLRRGPAPASFDPLLT